MFYFTVLVSNHFLGDVISCVVVAKHTTWIPDCITLLFSNDLTGYVILLLHYRIGSELIM